MEFWTHLSRRARLIVIGILAIMFVWSGVILIPKINANPGLPIVPADSPAKVTVYVAGAVKNPGVYTLRAGTRVKDAIAAAGGPAPKWDPLGVNLAKHLEDEEMVVVPKQGAAQDASIKPASKTKTSGPVSLNRATIADLEKLPGVGPGMAKRILDYRSAHGGFRTVQGLRSVPGIGDKKFQRMKPFLQL